MPALCFRLCPEYYLAPTKTGQYLLAIELKCQSFNIPLAHPKSEREIEHLAGRRTVVGVITAEPALRVALPRILGRGTPPPPAESGYCDHIQAAVSAAAAGARLRRGPGSAGIALSLVWDRIGKSRQPICSRPRRGV